MNGQRATLGADHFQRLYDASPDPWRFGSSKYEQAKYRRTIASLSSRRFRSGFEAGCSVGVLTRMLATHCDTLLAVDIVEAPLQAARSACADQSWVRFAQMQIPGQWPTATFDLIVLSEVLYFLSPADVARAADRVIDTLEPGGIVLLVNWRGRSSDPCTGDEAAEVFINRTLRALSLETHYHEPAYRLDALRRIGQTKDRARSRKRISPGPEQGEVPRSGRAGSSTKGMAVWFHDDGAIVAQRKASLAIERSLSFPLNKSRLGSR